MKQKRQLGFLLVLVLIGAGVWLWNLQGGKTIITDVSGDTRKYPPLNVDNPTLRMYEIDRVRKAEYKSSGRNIFTYIASAPAASRGHRADPVIVPKMPCGIEAGPCIPPPPEPPKLPPNIKYFGFGVVPNGASRRAFFHDTNGDEVYVVAEGEVLLNRYRILRIGNTNLEFEEISSGRMGTAPLEEQSGGPTP